MITNITLENFKCFRHVDISPKLVTLFIGPNGTGKSGILQALLLLKQSKDASEQLDLDGALVSLTPEQFMSKGLFEWDEVGLSVTGFPAVDTEAFSCLTELSIPTRCTARAVRLKKDGLWDPRDGEAIEALTHNLRIVPETRGLTRHTYHLGPSSHEEITLTAGPSQQEEELASTLAYSRSDVSRVSDWMNDITGVGFQADTVPPQSVRPVSITTNREISLVAEGFGTNALIQLLFELARAVEGATILMEEPEIHLHPKAQAELSSVIVEEAKASNKQVIMTTHSEHIAGRLLTLVAERKLTPDEVAIYSFEKDPETGICSANEIEVTPRGQVQGGLGAFFEADMDEMRRYVDALRAQE